MVKAKHKPPSRIRYEKSHPTISFRLTKAEQKLLKQRLEDVGLSFAEFVKESLGILEPKLHDIAKMRKDARQSGYDTALKEWQVWYFCTGCNKRILIRPGDNDHKAMIGYMRERGWKHTNCPDD